MQSKVVVIGAGISGLAAAHRLSRLAHHVTVLEASGRLGGQIHTATLADRPVDLGAEALIASAPGVVTLLEELGLTDDVVHAVTGRTLLWTERGLQALPSGVGPSGPTRLGPVIRSRVLSLGGLARAALEPLVPRRTGGEDVAVGDFVAARFGRQVADRFVDPLLGGLHAGDVHRLSLRATSPQLAAIADQHRSIVLAHRSRAGGAPSFISLRGGMGTLVEALASTAPLRVRCATTVRCLASTGEGYRVELTDGTALDADAVVMALAGHRAGALLRDLVPEAARHLGQLTSASVATVVMAYPSEAVQGTALTSATGILVPSTRRRLLKSATFLSTKWPHLHHPHHVLVRLSAGRARESQIAGLDDDELVQRLHADLAEATGLAISPGPRVVQRWPSSLAQLEVGHLDRLATLRSSLAGHPRVALAGAAYDGVGIASCLRSGEAAATQLHRALLPNAELVG